LWTASEADVDGVVMETGAVIKGVDDVMVGEGIGRAVDERCSVVAATNAGFGDCVEVTNVAEPPSRGNDIVVASFFFMASVSLTAVVAGLVTSDVVTVSGGDVDSEVDGEVVRTGAVAVGGGSRALMEDASWFFSCSGFMDLELGLQVPRFQRILPQQLSCVLKPALQVSVISPETLIFCLLGLEASAKALSHDVPVNDALLQSGCGS
jgi:hypothetical protein